MYILCLIGEGWIEEGLGEGGGGLSPTARDNHVTTLCRRCTRGRGMKQRFERRDVGVGLFYFHGVGGGRGGVGYWLENGFTESL